MAVSDGGSPPSTREAVAMAPPHPPARGSPSPSRGGKSRATALARSSQSGLLPLWGGGTGEAGGWGGPTLQRSSSRRLVPLERNQRPRPARPRRAASRPRPGRTGRSQTPNCRPRPRCGAAAMTAASAVPPVAIRSSISSTLSPAPITSAWISIVSTPYSSA